MKFKHSLYLLSIAFVLFAFSTRATAFAQSNCLPVNNGGQTTQQFCPPDQQTTSPTNAPSQTKGGLPIYPSSHTQATPNTGPEDWALPSLAILGIAGLWLRKKAKIT